jgi:hypothetical protein
MDAGGVESFTEAASGPWARAFRVRQPG